LTLVASIASKHTSHFTAVAHSTNADGASIRANTYQGGGHGIEFSRHVSPWLRALSFGTAAFVASRFHVRPQSLN